MNISSISISKSPPCNVSSFVSRIIVNEYPKTVCGIVLVLLWFRIIGKTIKTFGFHKLCHPEEYSEPCQTSEMERFAKKLTTFSC